MTIEMLRSCSEFAIRPPSLSLTPSAKPFLRWMSLACVSVTGVVSRPASATRWRMSSSGETKGMRISSTSHTSANRNCAAVTFPRLIERGLVCSLR